MTDYDYIGTNRPDGAIFGLTSSDKVGFFGTTPCDQPASSNQAAVTAITTTHNTTTITAVVENLTTLLNQIRTDLVELGLIKGES
jgi:hypothetical protein